MITLRLRSVDRGANVPTSGNVGTTINVVAAVVLLLLGGCSAEPGTSSSGVEGIQILTPADRPAAPKLSGELLDGVGTFHLAEHAGDVVVVNFWGSWCAPCVAEADDLEQTYQATRATQVTFVGINIRDGRDQAKRFVVGRVTYPNVFDPASKLALGFTIPPGNPPSTVIIDRQGRVATVIRRAVFRDELEPVVSQLAAEAPPAPS